MCHAAAGKTEVIPGDKYREKLEGINTGYQNAKDIHEQEQSAYEEELYEIETV